MISASFRPWIRAARPIAHGMIALPLLLGQAFAHAVNQGFEWRWFAAIHLYGVGVQVHVLYLNDHADEALDRSNRSYWLSGGSRVIPDGELSGHDLLRGARLAAVALVGLALMLAALGRPFMLPLVALSLLSGWSYSLPPVRSSYRGWGEIQQGLSCGLLLPVTAYYLQRGSLIAFPWALTVPIVVVFFASNVLTALPDRVSDAAGGKRSYPVRHGASRARRHAVLLLGAAHVGALIASRGYAPLMPTMLFVTGPALVLLGCAVGRGLRGFIGWSLASQVWLLVGWTVLLW